MKPKLRTTADPRTAPNRFAGGGVAVLGEDFTDREVEREEIARSLRTPKGHLVVSGLRRIGKTSILIAVKDELIRKGHPVIYVDLWTASTVEDMVTRLATAATAALGRRWRDTIADIGQRLQLTFEVSEAPGGILLPVPKVSFREATLSTQRQRLVDALDLLEALAKKNDAHLGVIIDEFQEIERLGSEGAPAATTSMRRRGKKASEPPPRGPGTVSAMRQVRAAIQHHRHVTYVFAGSDRRLIQRLHDEDGGALHNLGRTYDIGPIAIEHFAPWIAEQFAAMGITSAGCERAIIALAGPRTRDVRTLAETVAELARASATITDALVTDGMHVVVRQRNSTYEADWKRLTRVQQNLLRAIVAEGEGLTRRDVRQRFGLGEGSTVSKLVESLVERAVLLRDPPRILFDDPFYRAWIISAVLPDVGIRLPITHLAAGRPDQQTQG